MLRDPKLGEESEMCRLMNPVLGKHGGWVVPPLNGDDPHSLGRRS